MVEIVIEPWKKIVIHEVIEFRIDDYLRMRTVNVPPGGQSAPIMWANGIVFDRGLLADEGPVLEEKVKGIIHYSHVNFSLKPDFEPEIVDTTRNITILFIDVSDNKIYIQLSDLLKQQSKYKKS